MLEKSVEFYKETYSEDRMNPSWWTRELEITILSVLSSLMLLYSQSQVGPLYLNFYLP